MPPESQSPLAQPLEILREACERFGYTFRVVDTWSSRLVEVSDGRRSFLAGTDRISVYPLNSAVAVAVAQDKAHTYQRLEQCGYHIPRTGHFFLTDQYREVRPNGREIDDGRAFARDVGYPVFVKPNQGSFARNAAPAYDETELLAAFERIAPKDYSAIVQEFLDLPEFRIFMLEGQVRFAYRKSRATIAGDGATPIHALVRRSMSDTAEEVLESPFLRRNLNQHGLTANDALERGRTLEITPVANLAAGGKISAFYESVPEPVRAWASGIADSMGLRLLGIDGFFPDGLEQPESALVLDVNGSPTLTSVYHSGRSELALAIWKDILRAALSE